MALDPRTQAARRDLADIRLAEYVFAPHYVEPLARIVLRDGVLRESPAADAAIVAHLKAGETFDLLDTVGGTMWGIATQQGLVGYIEAEAIGAGPQEAQA